MSALAGHTVSVSATQLCPSSVKGASDKTETNGETAFRYLLYGQEQVATGQIGSTGCRLPSVVLKASAVNKLKPNACSSFQPGASAVVSAH